MGRIIEIIDNRQKRFNRLFVEAKKERLKDFMKIRLLSQKLLALKRENFEG